MSFSEQDSQSIIDDESKSIDHGLIWRDVRNHPPAKEFQANVATADGHPLIVCGRYDRRAKKLSFTLIHGGVGRIYALDIGAPHRNPTGELLGVKHKHRWSVSFRGKVAYVPDDITVRWDQQVEAWEQSCAEAKIVHAGTLPVPMDQQEVRL